MADKQNSDKTRAQLHALARRELAAENLQSPDVDPIQSIVRRANVQVGLRDLILLTISSLFALLLVFVAPLISQTRSRGGAITKPAIKPRK
jgi:hypothetical protein